MTIPTRSSPMVVQPEWIDFNGHLNMAYYSVLFDKAVDELYPALGFGADYQKTGFTTYIAEFHVCYLRELHVGSNVNVTFHLIDFDEKRFHLYQEMWHEDGWLAATGEGLTLHVDQSGPKVAPMPRAILKRLGDMREAQAGLPIPERVGRRIGLRR